MTEDRPTVASAHPSDQAASHHRPKPSPAAPASAPDNIVSLASRRARQAIRTAPLSDPDGPTAA